MRITVLGIRAIPGDPGEMERACEQLYPYLTYAYYEISVITRAAYADPKVKDYRNIRLIPVVGPRIKYLGTFVYAFFGVLKANKICTYILHVQGITSGLFVPLARLMGMRVVLTHYGPAYHFRKAFILARWALRLSEWAGVTFANRVIAVTATAADHIQKRFNRQAVMIRSGTVLPALAENWVSPSAAETLAYYNLEANKYVLAVGSFVPENGLHDLVTAFDRARLDDWKLIIIGDVNRGGTYGKNLKILGLRTKDVMMPGGLTGQPLQDLYAHAGLYVLPSADESVPRRLLTAMGYGLNCIASDLPVHRETCLEESRFFMPGDVNSLAARIREFAGRPLNRKERVRQVDRIKIDYTWSAAAEKLKEVYEDLFAKDRQRQKKPI